MKSILRDKNGVCIPRLDLCLTKNALKMDEGPIPVHTKEEFSEACQRHGRIQIVPGSPITEAKTLTLDLSDQNPCTQTLFLHVRKFRNLETLVLRHFPGDSNYMMELAIILIDLNLVRLHIQVEDLGQEDLYRNDAFRSLMDGIKRSGVLALDFTWNGVRPWHVNMVIDFSKMLMNTHLDSLALSFSMNLVHMSPNHISRILRSLYRQELLALHISGLSLQESHFELLVQVLESENMLGLESLSLYNVSMTELAFNLILDVLPVLRQLRKVQLSDRSEILDLDPSTLEHYEDTLLRLPHLREFHPDLPHRNQRDLGEYVESRDRGREMMRMDTRGLPPEMWERVIGVSQRIPVSHYRGTSVRYE